MSTTPRPTSANLSRRTLVDILRWRAQHQPDRTAYTFLLDGETREDNLTYRELDRRARAIAAHLQSLGATGERALLLFPPGLDYIAAFFGCLYAGVVAVPAYPPPPNKPMPRIQAIVSDAQARFALSTAQMFASVRQRLAQHPDLAVLHWLSTDDLSAPDPDAWRQPRITGDTLAFLQYTSGSTAAPKGVMVTHGNIIDNERVIEALCHHTEDSDFVCWLPMYHDMGLIGNVLQALYLGSRCVLMSPVSFLQKPARWLQAVSRYRAHTSGGPNFAFELCATKITPEQAADLDLSQWRVAFSGAEPIQHATLQRFLDAFSPYGLRPEALYPCYGLAEATLMVSGSHPDVLPVARSFQREALAHNSVLPAAGAAGAADAQTLVSSGRCAPGQHVAIVNPETLVPCPPDQVGEIWVAGPSVAHGYWQRPEETAETFHARLPELGDTTFLRTGDLGFLLDEELFITGRLKDLIIIRGSNHYPQDIELTAEQSHSSLRPGAGAAFSVEIAGEERLVVVQEVDRHFRQLDLADVAATIRQAIAREHQLQAHAVVLLRPGAIPKTSSGKIQRRACRSRFLAGTLDAVFTATVDDAEAASPDEPALTIETIEQTPAEARQALLTSYLVRQVAEALRVAASEINADTPLSGLLDSLTAIELRNTIETALSIELPVASLLDDHTPAQLAAEVLARLEAPAPSQPTPPPPLLAAAPHADHGDHPLSYGQQSLWFLHQLAPESSAYNLPGAIRIRGHLDVSALRRAFQTLIERHASLRTSFIAVRGAPVQRVAPHVPLPLYEEDAADWSEAALTQALHEEAHRPFDLARAPLFRVIVYRRSPREHILLLAMHHIIADFWSLAVLLHELDILYSAAHAGHAAHLPPPSLRYTDFARWQADMLAGAEGERHWSYWRRALSGELPTLDLPTDRPRPPAQTYHGASRGMLLGPDLTRRLKAFSQSRGVTLYTTLLAAFQTLLHRYTGQPDIIVGSPTAGRDRPELASLAGYFVNPVAIRANFTDDPTAADLLRQLREKVLAALDHQAFPFSLLVERLQPVRDPSRSPIFNVMFTVQRAPHLGGVDLTPFALRESWGRWTLGGLTAEPIPLDRRSAQFDLTFTVGAVEDDLGISLEYNTDLFDDTTIARMLGHYQTMLESIIDDPSQRVSTLPLLTPAERRQLRVTWNDTAHIAPEDVCVHQLIEAQVERTPHAVAVVCDHTWLTYRELNRRANQLARYLRKQGVGPQVRVGLCMERSVDVVVGLLAILKAGGAYVPLDPTYPADRLAAMIHGARISILLTHRRLADRLPTAEARAIALDEMWATIAQEPEKNVVSGVTADDLMYVIFTSGSTGEPKGAGVYHRGFVNLLHWFVTDFSITAADHALLVTSLSFDLTQKNIYAPLLVGGTLHLLASQHYDPTAIARTIVESRVTLLNCTPSGLYPLVEAADPAAYQRLATLRAVFLGGEPISVPRLADWMASPHCHAEIVNTYGPTECTDICAAYRLDPDPQSNPAVVPIGKPIYNVELFILDAHLQLLPVGAVGELCIGGAGVGAGYVNDADLTAARFVPHPFSDEPGALLYRTGDLARYLPDGNIEFMGRGDNQVKLRGFRIELGEIETVLEQHPNVRQTVVIARQLAPGEKRLVAYVVPEGDTTLTHQALVAHVRERLPEYMVPSAFVSLSALPLSPNGKVDRRGLPAPTYDLAGDADYAAPRTPVEQTLASIWAEVLGRPRVGIHDNLFEIGGDSILGIQIVARANQAGVHITPSQMYQAQTIAEMAAVAGAPTPAEPRLDDAAGAFPLTPIQRWLFDQHLPEPHHWNQALLLDLRQPLDVGRLEAALRHLIAHHDTLRLRFAPEGTTWRQWYGQGDNDQAVVTLVDLSALSPAEQRRAIQRTADSIQSSLSLADGPLMRVAVFDLGPAIPSQMLWVIHHLAVDGVSWRFLLEDLQTAYQQVSADVPVQLPPSSASYQTWASHLLEYAHSDALLGELDHWLAVPAVPSLPTDSAGANVEGHARTLSVALTAKETRTLIERAPRALQARIDDILTAALAQALSQWTGAPDALIDVEHHGREPLFDDVDLSRTVGWFTAIYPVHLTVNPSASPRQALRAVKTQLRRVPGRGIGYGILRYLHPNPEIAERMRMLPHAEVCFNYLGQLDQTFAASTLFQRSADSPGATHGPRGERPYLVELTCFVADGQLQAEWTYGGRIHKRATIAALARAFLSSLRALLTQSLAQPTATSPRPALPVAAGNTPDGAPTTRRSNT